MALSLLRFDMRAPESGAPAHELYSAALDMAAWADEKGFAFISLSEHHCADDGYLPSPLVMAGAVAARTTNIQIIISALLAPLHNPIRLAEDIAVLDLISKGRISYVTGLGYRPEEYAALGVDWKRRGRILDETIETLQKAWTGEPFTHDGADVVVRPRPLSEPHPTVYVGGSNEKSARRAARFRLPFMPAIDDHELAAFYRQCCEEEGFAGGFALMPGDATSVVIADDADAGWRAWGPYFLHDATMYASWQTEDIRSQVASHATTVDDLRAEGKYAVMTPEECVAWASGRGAFEPIIHFPLVGGAPPELGWRSLELYADKVLPRLP